jgi:hypothetical protein
MKNPIKVMQTLIFTLCLIFGVVIGTSGTTYANLDTTCGKCDYDDYNDLTFCNFTSDWGQCSGNNGDACGSVWCDRPIDVL